MRLATEFGRSDLEAALDPDINLLVITETDAVTNIALSSGPEAISVWYKQMRKYQVV